MTSRIPETLGSEDVLRATRRRIIRNLKAKIDRKPVVAKFGDDPVDLDVLASPGFVDAGDGNALHKSLHVQDQDLEGNAVDMGTAAYLAPMKHSDTWPQNVVTMRVGSQVLVLGKATPITQPTREVDAVFSYTGALPSAPGLSGPYPLPIAALANTCYVTASLGTADSSGDPVDVTVRHNGAQFATLSIPSGGTSAQTEVSISEWGAGGDYVQVEFTYAGSSAGDLVVRVVAY